jgi:SH3 domain-containing YSC84-like protein 1
MKTNVLGLFLLGYALSAAAVEKYELDNRLHMLTSKFVMMQRQPDKRIPADLLQKAQGIVLLDRTKAGFLFAYQGGGGVAMRRDPQSGQWGPAAFIEANEASLGFQIGGEQNFFVILLMNTNATHLVAEPNFVFGGEARGTAGDLSSGVEGTVASHEQPMWVFSDRKGLFGGAAIKGGSINPDEEANRVYYQQFVNIDDILFGNRVKPTEAAVELANKIAEFSNNSKQ